MKRAMNPFEKFHVDRLVPSGCAACGTYPCAWHHFTKGLKGLRITKEHLFGCPLCPKCHTEDKGIHSGDENKWCEDHGIDKNDYIGEVAVSLALWCSGRTRLRLV